MRLEEGHDVLGNEAAHRLFVGLHILTDEFVQYIDIAIRVALQQQVFEGHVEQSIGVVIKSKTDIYNQ